ncbi:MAG: hypothetical protein AB7O52_09915 [Planctomycetota bacterium]
MSLLRGRRLRGHGALLILPLLACGCGPAAISAVLSSSSSGGGSGGAPPSATDTVAPDTMFAPGSLPAPAVAVDSVTFVFSASEAGARFEGSVDQGAWFDVASPHTIAGLGEGPHDFRVRAIDAADNVDPTPAASSWTIDLTAPMTQIISAPPLVTMDEDASFEVAANEIDAQMEARLDGGPWQAVASPVVLTALDEGVHSFEVRAVDAAGNQERTPQRHDWEIERTGPDLTTDYPPATALTDAPSIVLRGRAADPHGVASVSLGSTIATTFDGFANWQVATSLDPGPNDLGATARDTLGNETTRMPTTHVVRAPILDEPIAAARGPNGDALVLDRALGAVLRVALPPTGTRATAADWTVASGLGVGLGPALDDAQAMALDPLLQRVLVTVGAGNALLAVDLASGDRTTIASDAVGSGPSLAQSWTVAVAEAGTFALVGTATPAQLVSVDLNTGVRSLVAGAGVGAGPPLQVPRGLALDDATGRAFWLDGGASALFAITLADGNRVEISGPTHGAGPPLTGATALALDLPAARAFVTRSGGAGIIELDIATGDRVELVGPASTAPPAPTAMLPLTPSDTRLHILDERIDGWIEVERTSGATTPGARSAQGSGPPLLAPIAVVHDTNTCWVADRDRAAVIAVDTTLGARTEVSGPTRGVGPLFERLEDLVALDDEHLLVADSSSDALIEIETGTGNRTELSGASRGVGPLFVTPVAIALDPTLPRVIVVDAATATLIDVELATGDRQVVSGSGIGGGAPFSVPRDVALRDDGVVAYVIDLDFPGIIEVALATGLRSPVPGIGATLQLPSSLCLDANSARAFVGSASTATIYSFNLQTGFVSVVSGDNLGSGPRLRAPSRLTLDDDSGTLWIAEVGRGAVYAVEAALGTRVIPSK